MYARLTSWDNLLLAYRKAAVHKRDKGIYYQRRFRQLAEAYADGRITFDQLTASVRGWVNHARYGNTLGLRKAITRRQIIPHPPSF
jgi:hypothetical protein